jgi:hypothetical protein
VALSSIELDLLGTRYTITVSDPTWARALTELWDDFVTTAASPGLPVEIDVEGDKTWLRLPGEPRLPFDEPWTLAEVLRYHLAEGALRNTSGLVLVHGAAVVRDGTAVLLVGPSGAGKTSLTLALLAAGWSLGSDDAAPLDPATGLIHPFPKSLGIRDPALWHAFAPDDWTPPWPEHEKSPVLVPPRLFARMTRPFPAGWIAFVEFDGDDPPRLERLSSARTATRLAEHTRDLSPGAVAALAELARSAPGAELRYPSSGAGLRLVEALTHIGRNEPETG